MRSVTPPPYLTGRRALRAVAAGLAAVVAVAGAFAMPAVAGAATLEIRGGGDGHGIGMSQYGAEGYALHGYDARAILAHYYSGTAIGRISPRHVVRVLLSQRRRASFSGASAAGRVRLSPSHAYRVRARAGGLAITDTRTGRTVRLLSDTITVRGRGVLRTAGGVYRGRLQFTALGGGRVRTVESVGLDDYVRGVVAHEMPASWAPAALQAQAIAARTYAITAAVSGHGFDLFGDTRSQAYGGVRAQTVATDAAVAATTGEVVTYAGRPAVTYFFASSGGHTESIQNVWPGATPAPWLQGVADPFDAAAGNPYRAWRVRMSVRTATRRLGPLVRGRLRRIDVTRRGVSPRIMTARVLGSRGTESVTGSQLQSAFGLPSTDARFTVRR